MYPNNTINQGHIAVSISEDDGGEKRDPFLIAAWVHLWCLERFTDFVRVFRELNVEADTRDLPREKRGRNPFRLATPEEEKCVRSFIKACRSGGCGLVDYPRFDMPNRRHEGTLTHRLACIKLKREPSGVGKQRELREKVAGYRGSTLDVHVGNLEVEKRVRGWTRKHGNQNQVVVRPRVPRKYKGIRYVRGVEGEEDGDEDVGAEGDVVDGDSGEEGEEPVWKAAAREPAFECRPQRRARGKKGGSGGADDDNIAAEEVESSDDDSSAADEDETDAEALQQQEQELKLKKKQMTRSGKRAKTEAESDEEDEDDDVVVVPSRKRARR